MRGNSRLSGVVHVLLHMSEEGAAPVTSERLAKAMRTNPAVIRRALAGLRERGYVRSGKGHGGGWTLACELSELTLRDVYEALGSPALLALRHRTEEPRCPIEAAVNAALDQAFQDAEEVLLARLGDLTLDRLRAGFQTRLAARCGIHDQESTHAS